MEDEGFLGYQHLKLMPNMTNTMPPLLKIFNHSVKPSSCEYSNKSCYIQLYL